MNNTLKTYDPLLQAMLERLLIGIFVVHFDRKIYQELQLFLLQQLVSISTLL